MSGVIINEMVFGSFLAVNLTHCSVYWVILSLCGWAYRIPLHLYWIAVPSDPKFVFLANGE